MATSTNKISKRALNSGSILPTAEKKPAKSIFIIGQLVFLTCGVYASFFIWGLLQERVGAQTYVIQGEKRRFKFPLLIVAMQSFFGFVVAAIGWCAKTLFSRNPSTPLYSAVSPFPTSSTKEFVIIGFTMAVGPLFGYAAMREMPYPIVSTLKMAKLIPIIVVGVLWHRTVYAPMKYLICVIITIGVLWFTLEDIPVAADNTVQHKFFGNVTNETIPTTPASQTGKSTAAGTTFIGIVFTFVSLFFDGLTSSTQDVVTSRVNINSNFMMLICNLSCLLWTVAVLLLLEGIPEISFFQPQLFGAINFFIQRPEALRDVALMGILNAVGQTFIFGIITRFGTLTLTAVTITRKTGSVLLSIIVHGHVLSAHQIFALIVVIFGVFLDAYHNVLEKTRAKPRRKLE